MRYNILNKGYHQIANAVYPLPPAWFPSAHTPVYTNTIICTQISHTLAHTLMWHICAHTHSENNLHVRDIEIAQWI